MRGHKEKNYSLVRLEGTEFVLIKQFFFNLRFYLFLERGEERERNIDV